MFYITNTLSARLPYHVEETEKDPRDQKQGQNHFDDESSTDTDQHERFLKANEKLYRERSVIVAGEMMNKKIFPLYEELSIEEAWRMIREYQFEYFPIVSSQGQFVGLLSEKEILRKIQNNEGNKSLKDVIAKETICAEEKTDLQEVIQVFFNENLEAVPILDEQQKVLGILSRNDLLQTILKVSQLRP